MEEKNKKLMVDSLRAIAYDELKLHKLNGSIF